MQSPGHERKGRDGRPDVFLERSGDHYLSVQNKDGSFTTLKKTTSDKDGFPDAYCANEQCYFFDGEIYRTMPELPE